VVVVLFGVSVLVSVFVSLLAAGVFDDELSEELVPLIELLEPPEPPLLEP
jgi:hypothetical protein